MPCRRTIVITVLLISVVPQPRAQTPIELPIVDRSAQPILQFAGILTSTERFSCLLIARAKNVGDKPILLVVAKVVSAHTVKGCAINNQLQMDKYFATEEIAPNKNVVFWSNPADLALLDSPQHPTLPLEQAAESRLVFVEFADGSSVGDESAAKGFFEYRAAMLDELSKLVHAYTSGGEEALVKALNEKAENSDVEWKLSWWRKLKSNTAIAQIKSMLEGAQMHPAGRLMRGGPSR